MKKHHTLTKNQERVYAFLKQYLTKNGEGPALGEIAEAMNVKSLRTVTQYLEALERKRLITRERYARGGIRLVEDSHPTEDIIQLPVFASANCGSLSLLAQRTFDEYIPVSNSLIPDRKKELYVIKASGNSLDEAGVSDGDFVLVERTQDVKANDLVVAIIDENAVIKKIAFANNAVILQPVSSDKSHQPIIMRRDFQVFGKVIDVIRVERSDELELIPIEDE